MSPGFSDDPRFNCNFINFINKHIINLKISNMKLSLRNLALGAAIMAVGAMSAQEPTVTQKWIYSGENFGYAGGACRTGNGWGGDVFVANGAEVQKVNADGVTTVYTHDAALNRCLTIDDAGNILVMAGWPSGTTGTWGDDLRTCDKFLLLKKADNYATATPVTVNVPSESTYPVNRFDVLARAIGDFTSEDGGLFYIVSSGAVNAMPVVIANSEGQDLSYTTTAEFGAANSMASAVPSIETMADLGELDEAMNTFYYRTGSVFAQIGYVNEDGEAAFLTAPSEDDLKALPGTWALQSQNGFDVFTLGEHTYQIRMAGPTVWTNQFVISDETGAIVYHSNYDGEYAINNPGTGNGCNIVARKVSPYKVEIYQIYLTSKTDKNFVAMYEMTIPGEPEPAPLYLVGQIQGWDIANPMQFAYSEGKYTLTYEGDHPQGFKISTAATDWNAFDAAAMHVEGMKLKTGNTYDLLDGAGSGNMTIPAGNYIFTVDLTAKTITVTGDEIAVPFTAPDLYIRGAFNEWGTTAQMTTDGVVVDGYVTYTWTADELDGAFKIGTADWGKSLGSYVEGGLTISEAGEYALELTAEGGEITAANLYKPTFTLLYPEEDGAAIKLTVAVEKRPEPMVDRNPFAYDVTGAPADNDNYNVTFKATGAAAEGEIVVTDAEGQTVLTQPLQNVVAGENTATVDISSLPEGAYTWAVRLVNMSERENLALSYVAPAEWAQEEAKAYRTTGAAVVINDPEADAYGYTVVGHGYALGYAVFDPAGNQIANPDNANGLFNVGVTNSGNGSSTSRGDNLGGLAVFADWSDSNSGYWVFDPLNPTTEIRNMLLVEGATQAADGTVTYNGVATGSGSPCVAFQGTGDETKMYAFDEDIYGNALVRYNIGTNTSIVAAPELVLSDYKGKMANTNIEVCPVEKGFFVSQNRADGADAGVPGLMYFDNAGALLWTGEAMGMPSFAGGVAVSNDGSMIANAGYDGYIRVSGLTYNEYDEPEFTTFYEYTIPGTVGPNNRSWMQINFDPANNLHVFNRVGTGYCVLTMPAAVATTPAKAEYTINKTSGIGNVNVENPEAPVRYFNLQGVEVPAESLAPGMYIRQQGNTSAKVVIR